MLQGIERTIRQGQVRIVRDAALHGWLVLSKPRHISSLDSKLRYYCRASNRTGRNLRQGYEGWLCHLRSLSSHQKQGWIVRMRQTFSLPIPCGRKRCTFHLDWEQDCTHCLC